MDNGNLKVWKNVKIFFCNDIDQIIIKIYIISRTQIYTNEPPLALNWGRVIFTPDVRHGICRM